MTGDAFAAAVTDDIAQILGADLVGVYLHGSLAFGCFNPLRSDVDLLVVTSGRLGRERWSRFERRLEGRSRAPYRIELSVLTRDDLARWRHPAPFELHFGDAGAVAAGVDHDLAVHVAVLRARGRVLNGVAIEEVFPVVPQEDVHDAIMRDLSWSAAHSTQVYGVLNAARAVAYAQTGELLSKVEGAQWALDRVPAQHRAVVGQALTAYRGNGDEPCAEPDVRAFTRWALDEFERAPPR